MIYELFLFSEAQIIVIAVSHYFILFQWRVGYYEFGTVGKYIAFMIKYTLLGDSMEIQ